MSQTTRRNERESSMTLIDEAERASKIRNALTNFVGPCAKHAVDVEKAIVSLSSLSAALREIDELIEKDSGPGLERIRGELEDVHDDVTFTLGDAWKCLGHMSRSMTAADFQHTWKAIVSHSKLASGKGFHKTLDESKTTLEALITLLKENASILRATHKHSNAGPLQSPFRATLPRGNTDLAINTGMNKLSSSQPTKQKSYERERNARPMSPAESSASSGTDVNTYRYATMPMSPPLSPAVTISSLSQFSSNAPSIQDSKTHWARNVLQKSTVTKFVDVSEQTRFHPPRGTVREHSLPDQTYESVFHLSVPEGMRLTLFCRPADNRAKIVCYYRDHNGQSDYSCLPLDELHLRRESSILRICRRRVSGKPEYWVSVQFTSYERLVLFANMFLAMRSQDVSSARKQLVVEDDELRDETSEFQGKIIENQNGYTLRLLLDKVTCAIRLQASRRGGQQGNVPVWTAFVTSSILNPNWCQLIDKCTVVLSDITIHAFTSAYIAKYMTSGGFPVRFEMRDDVEGFLDVVDNIRKVRSHLR